MKPVVSIIMPTYNTNKEYLKKAIDSIINQTYDFIELIIIDDCSVDDYEFISKSYNDKRIKLFRNDMNLGVARTLNRGLEIATGDYIVRMDSDDIAYRNRISRQLAFLQKNQSIDMVGSSIRYIGKKRGIKRFPRESDEIKSSFFFGTPIVHPSVMFRADKLKQYNIRYNPNFKSEDYELWTRCAQIKDFNFSNYSKVLLKYRIHTTQVTKQTKNTIREHSNLVRLKYIQDFGLQFNNEEMKKFNAFSSGDSNLNYDDFIIVDKLLKKIIDKNNQEKRIDRKSLEKIIVKKLFKEYLRKLISLKGSVKSYKHSEIIKLNRIYYFFLKVGSVFCYR
ncbi:glycosyltransferase family 2 protein [Neobacillus niacini]|uniref:glycosyltransferase family 2 protein n=1 Tax=Neobacillus niacini TaxID=86668 RepID=UPI00398369AE